MKKFVRWIIGMLFYAGLPILGWGVNDVNGYFQNESRMIYSVMIVVFTLGVVLFVPGESYPQRKGSKSFDYHKYSLALLQILPIALLIGGPFSDRYDIWTIGEKELLRNVGLFLTSLGYFFMNWSFIALDKQFSVHITIQEGHKLITSGPYAIVRHPRYLGILITFIGIAFVFRSLLALGIVGLILLVLIWRIRDEERLLSEQFGAEWDEYKERTSALLPFIY